MTLVLAVAAPTLAALPQRGCPPAFDGPVSIDELVAAILAPAVLAEPASSIGQCAGYRRTSY
jgi:hypothetical protein